MVGVGMKVVGAACRKVVEDTNTVLERSLRCL